MHANFIFVMQTELFHAMKHDNIKLMKIIMLQCKEFFKIPIAYLPRFLFHASVHNHVSVNIEHVFADLNLFIQETWVVWRHL